MIIEHFHEGKTRAIYERFAEKGRMMPEGLNYVNSWLNEDVTICYQVMEGESEELIQEWIGNWKDLADFEVIPVITSPQAKKKVMGDQ